MKKIVYTVLTVSLLLNVFFFAFGSVSQASAKESESQLRYTETQRSVFYTATWNNCLTMMTQAPNVTALQRVNYCKANLKQALTIKAFEYRHSDMWQPVPASIFVVQVVP